MRAPSLPRWFDEDDLERAARLCRRSKLHAKGTLERHGIWRLRGPLHGSGREISLLAIGPEGFETQLAHVFVSHVTGTETLGRLGRVAGRPARGAYGNGEDDIVAYVRRPWERAEPDELPMALSVDPRITLAGTPEEHVVQNLASQHRRAWNRRDTLGATFTLSSRVEDLRLWYETLHVPLSHLRHREHAHIEPFSSFEAKLPRTEVMLARLGGEVVAGAVLEHDPWSRTLTRTASGATPAIADDGKIYKVLTVALEYRGLERAHERRIPHYSLGFTLPRIDGGLFGYKRRWGASFLPDVWAWPAVVHIPARRRTSVLEGAPIITQPPGGTAVMIGVTGDDAASLTTMQDRIKLSSFPNARRIVIHVAAAHAARVRDALAEVDVPGVRLEIEVVAGDAPQPEATPSLTQPLA